MGKGTNMSTNGMEIKFKVVEPNGISLIDNLKAAVHEYAGVRSFGAPVYCLVVRFRGYDEEGNPVLAGNTDSGAAQSDPYTISIKYVPFSITGLYSLTVFHARLQLHL